MLRKDVTASTINFINCNSKQFPHWFAFQKCQIPQYTGNAWNSWKNIFYVSTEKLPVKLTYSLTWRTLHSAYKGHGRKDFTNSRRSLTCCKGLQKCLHLVNNKELEPHKSKFESWLSKIKLCHWATPKISPLRPGKEDRREKSASWLIVHKFLSFVCLLVFKIGDSILLAKLWDKGLFCSSLGHNNGRDRNCRSISLKDTTEIQILQLPGQTSSVSTEHILNMFWLLWLNHHQVRC